MRIAFGAYRKHAAKALSTITLLGIFVLFSSDLFAQPDGKKLFKGQCASCHYPSEKKLIGPGLKDVRTRWSSKPNFNIFRERNFNYIW